MKNIITNLLLGCAVILLGLIAFKPAAGRPEVQSRSFMITGDKLQVQFYVYPKTGGTSVEWGYAHPVQDAGGVLDAIGQHGWHLVGIERGIYYVERPARNDWDTSFFIVSERKD